VNLHEIVSQLIVDTKGVAAGGLLSLPSIDSSLGAFLPELCLCVFIAVLLLMRVVGAARMDGWCLAFPGMLIALWLAAPWQHLAGDPAAALDAAGVRDPAAITRMEIFTGMLVFDPFTVFMRGVLIGFGVLFLVFTKLSGIPDRENSPDVYALILGATLGMCLMASANHLLMVFMAVEMASVPSYVLAGLMKGRRLGSEAALKYSVFGAGAAGVMLYGISLIAGLLNTAHLPTLATRLASELPAMGLDQLMVLSLGGLMIMVGLAFKLSAVPFHFWCPDVFEGAPAEVGAFLSVASKAAAIALLVRVAIGFGAVPPEGVEPGQRTLAMATDAAAAQSADAARSQAPIPVMHISFQEPTNPASEDAAARTPSEPPGAAATETTPDETTSDETTPVEELPAKRSTSELLAGLTLSRNFMAKLIAFLAVITCTFGNLAAYGQHNIKRLLAYSTISHAGYMMMPVPAFLVMAGVDSPAAESAVAAIAIYIGVYVFMNLGAFAIVAFWRTSLRTEEISDYAGLIRRCPITVICFVLILFGLVGLPPLSGFVGKFAVFASLVDGYRVTAAAGQPAGFLLVVLFIGGLNTAISLFYYLRVAKVMTMEPEPDDRAPVVFADVSLQGAYVWLITLPTAILILNWDVLNRWAQMAAKYLLA